MENETVGAVTDAVKLLSPENLMHWAGIAAPYVIKVLLALLILWVGSKIAKWLGKKVQKNAVKAPNIDETLAKFIGSIVRYAVMAMV